MREDLQNIENVVDGFDGSRHDERAAIPPVRVEAVVRREAIARIQTMEAERAWLMEHVTQLMQARSAAVKRLGLLCDLIAIERNSVPPNPSLHRPEPAAGSGTVGGVVGGKDGV